MTTTKPTTITTARPPVTLDQLEAAFEVHAAAVAAALADATAACAAAQAAGKVTATTVGKLLASSTSANDAERRASRVADRIADTRGLDGNAAIKYAASRCAFLVSARQEINSLLRDARTKLRLNPTAARREVVLGKPIYATLVRNLGYRVRKDDVTLGVGDVLEIDPTPDRATGRVAVSMEGERYLLYTKPEGLDGYLARVAL